jgi:hypothetical protein
VLSAKQKERKLLSIPTDSISAVDGEKSQESSSQAVVITAGHPVLVGGEWKKPRDCISCTDQYRQHETSSVGKAEVVYNFILDHTHSLVVNLNTGRGSSVKELAKLSSFAVAVTLGHGMTCRGVEHPFLGNAAAVAASLSALPGWDDGAVMLREVVRHEETNMIVGMR